MESLAVLILAAGQGTRMKSDRVKVLHEVCGKPMVKYAVEVAREVSGQKPFVVVGYQAESVKECLGDKVHYIMQSEQRGTGHAVMQAEPYIRGVYDELIVLYGDTPLLSAETLRALVETRRRSEAGCSILTVDIPDPTGYGRIIRDKQSSCRVLRIVEHKDANPEELAITEVNSGIYCFDVEHLFSALPSISCVNAQREYYLTDVIEELSKRGVVSVAYKSPDSAEGTGINNRRELAEVSAIIRRRILDRLMLSGVTIEDPASTFIDSQVTIGRDTVIRPFTFIRGNTSIGMNCVIGPATTIKDCSIGDNVIIVNSVVEESRIANDVEIGPYSHLRPGNTVEQRVKIGNYAELKNSTVGEGSKIPHHSYAGDCTIGKGVNYSAGVISVNYDGYRKHRTVIEDGAFIGCNVNLIAPVKVGKGAYVAAGSTINEEVPADSLAIARNRQVNKENWAKKRREKHEGELAGQKAEIHK